MPPPNRARLALVTIAAAVGLTVGCSSGETDTATVTSLATSATTTPSASAGTGASTEAAAGPDSAAPGTTSPSTIAAPSDQSDQSDPADVVDYVADVVATHPHDTGAYTQGLEVVDGLLLESTGIRGESSVRVVDPVTGEPVRSARLDDGLFGEGATIVGDEVWQLTWTSETLLIHGLDDLIERRRLRYGGEGWGLCATGDRLVMSDGSSRLTIRDRTTFDAVDHIQVTEDGQPVDRLNELECVDGLVWANVYQTTRLVAVDPTDGRVVGRADIAALVPDGFVGDTNNVANGIAHDPRTGRFYLTGKRWPVLYEVELVPVS